MNISHSFTSNEKKIIQQISAVFIESTTRLADKGHPLFEDLKEAYNGDINTMDVLDGLLAKIITQEIIQKEPERIVEMTTYDLRLSQLIIKDYLPDHELPIAKKNLIRKLEKAIKIKTTVKFN